MNDSRNTIRHNGYDYSPVQSENNVQRIYVRKWYEKPSIVAAIIAGILAVGAIAVALIITMDKPAGSVKVEDDFDLESNDTGSSSSSASSDSGIAMSQVTVSSDVACCPTSQYSTSYDSNMLDGDPTTAWQIRGKAKRDATATFTLPRSCTLAGIRIRNGYQKVANRGTSLFYANSRPSWVRITLVSPEGNRCVYYDGELKDMQGWQTVDPTNKSALKFRANKILMTINTGRVYTGNRYSDVVISDVDFNLKQ